MLRRRPAAALLLVLAVCAAGPGLDLGTAPVSGEVLAAAEQPAAAPLLLSRATAVEHLARLWRGDPGGALPVAPPPHQAILAAAATCTGPALAPPVPPRRRALARRAGRAPDEPS